MHEDPDHIGWYEFVEAFQEHHVPKGVMDAKVEEFRNIAQGSMKVQEYGNRFITMMWYPPDDTNTEKKKMFFFKKGLNPRIRFGIFGITCHTLRV